jgi:hypothetical protein
MQHRSEVEGSVLQPKQKNAQQIDCESREVYFNRQQRLERRNASKHHQVRACVSDTMQRILLNIRVLEHVHDDNAS